MKNNNAAAFAELYSQYEKEFYSFALLMLNSQTDAEECMIESVIRVYKNFSDIKDPEYFKKYFLAVLSVECKRKLKTRTDKSRNIYDMPEAVDKYSLTTESSNNLPELQKALTELNDEEKLIILLSVIAEMKSKEIAKTTGLTVNSVENKMDLGLAKLREGF